MKSIKEIYTLNDCPICKNTRLVYYVDKKISDIKRTKDCSCVGYKSRLSNLKRARIPDSYIVFEYKDYNPDICTRVTDVEHNKKMHGAIGKLITKHDKIKEMGVDLLLYGPKACGKTLLGAMFLQKMILKFGYTGMFVTAEELILMATEKSSWNKEEEFNGITLEDLINVDFLMIDGFDKLVDTKVFPMVKVIINSVMKQRKHSKKNFIITSSKDLPVSNEFVAPMSYTLKAIELRGCYAEVVRKNLDKELGL